MSLCTVREQDRHELKLRLRTSAYRCAIRAMRLYDEEHMWRIAGEQAIRDEMERRVTIWLAKKKKVA